MPRWIVGGALISIFASLLSAAENQRTLKEVQVSPEIAVSYPDSWFPIMRYRNGLEFVAPPPGEGKALPFAKLLIRIETGKDHDEALRRLSAIIRESKKPTMVVPMNGWPAIQRQYIAPAPRTDERSVIGKNDGTEKMAVWITTVIAMGNLVVHEDAMIAQSADSSFVADAQGIENSIAFSKKTQPQQLKNEIKKLQDTMRQPAGSRKPAIRARAFTPPRRLSPPQTVIPKAVLLPKPPGSSEPELAASNDGQTVVVGSVNSGISFSTDGGEHFIMAANGGGVQNPVGGQDGDFSVAFGHSGTFYISELTYPFQSANSMHRSVGVATSSSGQSFALESQAILCQPDGCDVDQPHIAADRFNSGLDGKDQVYVVWRLSSALACSAHGGEIASNGQSTWSAPPYQLSGDHPRITVGPDGMVYVVSRPFNGSAVNLERFTSCKNGLLPIGMPVQVATWVDDENRLCPIAGLDRCGPQLAGDMVAVDDKDASHVYVAFANTSATGTEDIWVLDSVDGGQSFSGQVTVNPRVPAHRFMPWLCATGGTAIVSWYDRSRSTPTKPDLTDYLAAAVSGRSPQLTAWPPINVSGNADPQCATGFPGGVDVSDNVAVSCNPPQFIDKCSASNQKCSDTLTTFACPAAETCVIPGNGWPKYGDYSGNGCASGKFFALWTSATAPPGIAQGQVNGLREFVAVLGQTLTVNTIVVPPDASGAFNLLIDGTAQATAARNGGSTGAVPVSVGVHTVSETGSQLNCYSTRYSGDCDRSGMVAVNLGETRSCTVTNTCIGCIPLSECLSECQAEYLDCVQGGDLPGGGSPARCRPGLARCKNQCHNPCNR